MRSVRCACVLLAFACVLHIFEQRDATMVSPVCYTRVQSRAGFTFVGYVLSTSSSPTFVAGYATSRSASRVLRYYRTYSTSRSFCLLVVVCDWVRSEGGVARCQRQVMHGRPPLPAGSATIWHDIASRMCVYAQIFEYGALAGVCA